MRFEPFSLIGHRVRLEPLTLDHLDALVDAAAEDRSAYGFTLVPNGPEETRDYIERALSLQAAGAQIPFATVLDGRVVGSTRFTGLDFWEGWGEAPSAVEIGMTWLAASAQRTVANTEAKYLQFRHAFEAWGVQRVALRTDLLNERSQAALTRLGLTREGVLRHNMPAFGRPGPRDSVYYSAIPADWPGIKAALERRIAPAER